MKSAIFASLLALLPAAAAAQQVVVDDSFVTTQFNWQKNGANYIRWRPVAIEGTLHMCGARANLSKTTRTNRLNREVMKAAKITRDGQRIIQNLDYFSVVNRTHVETELVGQIANCRSMGLPASVGTGGFRLEFRRGSYSI